MTDTPEDADRQRGASFAATPGRNERVLFTASMVGVVACAAGLVIFLAIRTV